MTPSGGSSTTTDYLSDGDHEVAEYAAGATTPSKRFIYGKNVDEIIAQHEPATNSYSYAHRNHQGSVIAVSKAGGLVASSDTYTYSPYGEPNITTGFAYRYTGRRLDTETGLYYYRARYYDAQLGRFLQTDPVGYEDQMNLYAYVGNDPVNYSDPLGKSKYKGDKSESALAFIAAKIVAGTAEPGSKTQQLAERVANMTSPVEGSAKARSGAKRIAAREAQRQKQNPRVATSQSGENMQGNKYGETNLRGQVKVGMDGETKIGIQDGSKDRNNGEDHKPAVDVGNLKEGEQPGNNGQPRISGKDKVKVEIKLPDPPEI